MTYNHCRGGVLEDQIWFLKPQTLHWQSVDRVASRNYCKVGRHLSGPREVEIPRPTLHVLLKFREMFLSFLLAEIYSLLTFAKPNGMLSCLTGEWLANVCYYLHCRPIEGSLLVLTLSIISSTQAVCLGHIFHNKDYANFLPYASQWMWFAIDHLQVHSQVLFEDSLCLECWLDWEFWKETDFIGLTLGVRCLPLNSLKKSVGRS